MHKKFIPVYVILSIAGLIMILPVLMMLSNSIMGGQELKEAYGAVLGGDTGKLSARLLPVYPTLAPYVELLLDSPDFFVMFWNSVKQVFSVMLGQTFVGTMAAWAFARYEFRGRRPLFLLYMILMVMPFQVTMVSSYLVLSKLSLLDTHLAVILPGIFSTFPGESGRCRRVYRLPENRDTPWKPGNHLRADFKFSRILERSGSAYDIFKNKIQTAPLPVPAGNHHRPDGRIFRGVGGDDASGGAGVPMGKRLPAKRD